MFGCFQTILNEIRSLGITFDNYDDIDKILRSKVEIIGYNIESKESGHHVPWRTYWNLKGPWTRTSIR